MIRKPNAWSTWRRAVRVVSEMADLLAQFRPTPIGIISTLARGFETWERRSTPSVTEAFSAWTKADIGPAWIAAKKKAEELGIVETVVADPDISANAIELSPTAAIGWVTWAHHLDGPYIPPGVTIEEVNEAINELLWRGVGAHGMLVRKDDTFVLDADVGAIDARSPFADEVAAEINRFRARGKLRSELLWSVPGSGKSVAVRSVARALGGRSLSLAAHDVTSWSGAPALIRALRPTVVIVHDIDKAQGLDYVLTEIEQLRRSAILLATCNDPDAISAEVSRPERFDRIRQAPRALRELGMPDEWLLANFITGPGTDATVLDLPIVYALEYGVRHEVLGLQAANDSVEELRDRASKAERDAKARAELAVAPKSNKAD